MAIARRIRAAAAWALAILVAPACNAISGVGDYDFPYAECFPGEVVSCYSGPPPTENIGLCRGGQRRCSDDGAQLGPCEGEVTPDPIDNCATPQDEDCDGSPGPKCSGSPVWLEVFGAENGNEEAADVAADASGRPILCGTYDVGFELAPGITLENETEAMTSFVAALTPGGVGVWGVGDAATDAQLPRRVRGLAVDRGDGAAYAVGDDQMTLYAKKISSAGAVLWDQDFGPATDGAVVAHGSGIVLVGSSAEAIDFGGEPLPPEGDNDVVMARLTGAGAHVSSRRFGPTGEQRGGSVAADAEGNLVVAGCFQAAIDLGCEEALAAPSNNRAYFIARLSPDGACLWNKAYPSGEASDGCAPHVAADASGNVVFAALAQGTIDFGGGPLEGTNGNTRDIVIAKLAPDGSHRWSKRFGEFYEETVGDVAVDPAGNVLLTGSFLGRLNFGTTEDTEMEKAVSELLLTDGYIVKFDPAGNFLWSFQIAAANQAQGTGVTADPAGNVLVTGWFEGNLTLGDLPAQESIGGRDIFVAKLSP